MSQSVSDSMSASESASASSSISASVSVSTSMSTSVSSSEVKDPKHKHGSQALPKTGEEDSSAALALGALATATGLAFLAKRKKEEEGEDF
ncbi:LPXTG-motif cell wall anchor domain protein [Streptococcus sp. C150]|jgi:epidermal growth factor receptor substrate 15|nr:LPXTG-motif cell wall anchor domain protein [Streptococcus sp. C150]